MHAEARTAELGAASPVLSPTLAADAGLASATRLVRRIDERFSGVTALLVTADLVAIAASLVLTRATALPSVWVALALLLCCRVSARVHRSRLRLSWFDDMPRELVALAVAAGVFQLGSALFGLTPDLLHVSAALA